MIKATLIGDTAVVARLDKMSVNILAKVRAAITEQTFRLSRAVQEDKLNGQVLNRRTGTLVRSIARGTGIVDTAESTIGIVGLGGADLKVVKYGALHEYGGTVKAHIVMAKNKKALCFTINGQKVFAKSVSIPDVVHPAKRYLRGTLEERTPAIIAAVNEAVTNSIKESP